jgi:hypothetical protein
MLAVYIPPAPGETGEPGGVSMTCCMTTGVRLTSLRLRARRRGRSLSRQARASATLSALSAPGATLPHALGALAAAAGARQAKQAVAGGDHQEQLRAPVPAAQQLSVARQRAKRRAPNTRTIVFGPQHFSSTCVTAYS